MVDTCVSGAYGAIRGGSSPPSGIIKRVITFVIALFIQTESDTEPIGFQDSCDGSFQASMPNFRAIEADL